MKRRGFVFTLDALLSLVLVMIFVVSVVSVESQGMNVYSTYMRSQNTRTAQSTLELMRTASLENLVSPQKINEWISTGVLNTTLVSPSMSPLDIAATYWAAAPVYPSANLTGKANIILGYILNNTLKGYNYQLIINNYTSPYLSRRGANYSTARDVSSATITLTGYAYNQTPRGYMARAYLTKATHENANLVVIQRVLGGGCTYYGNSNDFTANVTFTIPSDAEVFYGDAMFATRSSANNFEAWINGHGPYYTGYYSDNSYHNYLRAGLNWVYADITTNYCGWPTWWFDWPSFEAGFGSGSSLLVKYRTNSTATENPNFIKLYDTTSYTGIVYFLSIVPTGNVTGISIHLSTSDIDTVRLYYQYGANVCDMNIAKAPDSNGVVDYSSQEILSGLENCGVTYSDLGDHAFTLVLAFDARYSPGIASGRNWYYSGLDDSAVRLRVIHGGGDSWVKVDVIPRILETRYSIPLAISLNYDDFEYSGTTSLSGVYSQIKAQYTLPENAQPWYADYLIAIQFTDSPTGPLVFWENDQTNGTIYNGPADWYLYRFGYSRFKDAIMQNGTTNTFYGESYDSNYGFRYQQTRGIIKYFIQAYAGYGDVFPELLQGYPVYGGYNLTYYYSDGSTVYQRSILVGSPPYKSMTVDDLDPNKYAVDDAILRLFDKLNYVSDVNPGEWKSTPYDGSSSNPIDVDLPSGVSISTASMGNIPSGLFAPVQITLRVWREH
ncbi:hypothetical protein JCM16138_01440 [Thermococcus atlanticus]